MQDVLVSIAPIFGLLALGQFLFRIEAAPETFWPQAARLVYWALMPALLFSKLSTAEFDGDLAVPYAAALVGGFVAVVSTIRIAAPAMGLSRPAISSTLQGAARHNTFIALAVAERLFGQTGLALASLAAAILVLVTNLTITPMMVGLARDGGEDRALRAILRDVCRNPIIVGVLSGLAVNAATDGPLPVIHDMTRILGSAALPLMLLCVGATLRFGAFNAPPGPLMLATGAKLALFPFAVFAICRLAGISGEEATVALIFAAAPTAASSQALARELGGDVPLMVNIVTLQTALAFLTLPATLHLAALATP